MATHDIEISIPRNAVVNADVVFEVKSDGEKLGELRVSKGSIDWSPASWKHSVTHTWERFDALMREQDG